MPQILVVTDQDQVDSTIVYRERVSTSDLDSDHFSGQLVERVGWAMLDAEEMEQTSDRIRSSNGGAS
jgi:hypothetical protein